MFSLAQHWHCISCFM